MFRSQRLALKYFAAAMTLFGIMVVGRAARVHLLRA